MANADLKNVECISTFESCGYYTIKDLQDLIAEMEEQTMRKRKLRDQKAVIGTMKVYYDEFGDIHIR